MPYHNCNYKYIPIFVKLNCKMAVLDELTLWGILKRHRENEN